MGWGSNIASSSSKCAVQFGTFLSIPIASSGEVPTVLNLIAPPQPMPGPVRLMLRCDSDTTSSSSVIDLGAELEYCHSATLDFTARKHNVCDSAHVFSL